MGGLKDRPGKPGRYDGESDVAAAVTTPGGSE